jgi:EAL domain-containing protein (putative c-di-GMP-specific phosphodiesterase class I)
MLELSLMGVKISLDDFGTGLSSLGQLKDLPVDVLKIDRVFVQENFVDRVAFLRAIVALGHSLGLVVVAEGIEDGETVSGLSLLGCEVGEGFYFGRPLAVAEAVMAVPELERRARMQLGL